MNNNDFKLVQRNTDEWDKMWNELAQHPLNNGDAVCEESVTGECWQYMGTQGGKHNFRHRFHPNTGCRQYLDIDAVTV